MEVYLSAEPFPSFGNILKKKVMENGHMNYEFCDGVTHTVKKGDTLYEISRRYKVPLALLLRANPYVDVFNLQVGDTICIPTGQSQITPYPVNGAVRSREPVEKEPTERQPVTTQPAMPASQPVPAQSTTPSGQPMPTQSIMPSSQPVPMQPSVRRNTSGMEQQSDDDYDDCDQTWVKYVVQPGDTLADVLKNMDGDVEDFAEKNGLANIYMLPGVAYYICAKAR